MIKYLKKIFVGTEDKKTHAEASLTARRQLIGVAVLLIVAVVFFSLVFDSQPRGVEAVSSVEMVESTPVAMPQTATVAAKPEAQVQQLALIKDLFVVEGANKAATDTKAKQPVTTVSKPVAHNAEQAQLEPLKIEQDQVKKTTEPSAQAKHQAEQAAQDKRQAEQAAQAKRQAAQSTQTKQQAEQDANAKRAYAILNANNAKPSAKVVVQVGAYSDPGRAKDVQQQIKQYGVTAYLQTVTTANGPVTRVRVGPFDNNQQAQAVVTKLAKGGYKASLLTQ